ncbi:hypothetical protein EVAR_30635_1 [Eumeta japonica]|uniref:Uncharacterized protein n=1 Tax=Eumeta variegata TaxID=151549 RepID=A0A4C1VS78_EUMVA|nr:hypothetical protein EVAR_30635_1 [Eumeta japonica]
MVRLKDIIHYELLPPGKSINSDFYYQQLMRLKQEVEKKRTFFVSEDFFCLLITQPAAQSAPSTRIFLQPAEICLRVNENVVHVYVRLSTKAHIRFVQFKFIKSLPEAYITSKKLRGLVAASTQRIVHA